MVPKKNEVSFSEKICYSQAMANSVYTKKSFPSKESYTKILHKFCFVLRWMLLLQWLSLLLA